jgi:hypothetical protein
VRPGGLDQLPHLVDERRQRRRLECVDPPLPERTDRDKACAGEGLEVLGGLRLTQAGELGQLTDRSGAFGEELDDAPPLSPDVPRWPP